MGFLTNLMRLSNSQGEVVMTDSKSDDIKNYDFDTKVDELTGKPIDNPESVNIWNVMPFKINRSIPNYRYAFKYDSTTNRSVNNLIIIANRKFKIEAETPEYEEDAKMLRNFANDIRLDDVIDNFIQKGMIDGDCFINRYVKNGELRLKFLANDGKKFKWKIINDPETGEPELYKQLETRQVPPKGYKTMEFKELENKMVEKEFTNTFEPDEIIHIRYMPSGGKGVSVLYALLDIIAIKNQIISYMPRAAHKAGAFLGVKIGNEHIDQASVPQRIINKVIDWFSTANKKEVVAYPDGISPEVIGNVALPDYVTWVKFLDTIIQNGILTPDSKFSSNSSNRATAAEQLNTLTGYQGFIEYIQDWVTRYVEKEIFNKYLEIKGKHKSVNKIKLIYNNRNVEDSINLAKIAMNMANIYPDLPSELAIRAYFPDYADLMDRYISLYGDKWLDHIDKDMGKLMPDSTDGSWSSTGMNAYNMNKKKQAELNKKKKQENESGQDFYKEV